MRKGFTTLSKSEKIWWQQLRRAAELQAWKSMCEIYPRLREFPAGPAGAVHGFKYQGKIK